MESDSKESLEFEEGEGLLEDEDDEDSQDEDVFSEEEVEENEAIRSC